MSRRAPRLAALVVTIAAVILGTALPAHAHNYLVSSTPEADSTVTELPAAFSVTTNEPLLDLSGTGAGFAIEVLDGAGRYYGDGCIAVEGATASTGASLGEAGEYTLLWQVISEDGHAVSGEFAFTWAPAPGAELASGSGTPPDCGGTVEPSTPTPEPTARADANLSDVLWIGGAIAAVLVAAVVTFLVVSRRRA